MSDPYTTPQTSPPSDSSNEELRRKRKFWLRAIPISIAGVILPPLLATLFTAFGMFRSFSELSQGDETNSDASRFISISLTLTAGGLLMSGMAFMVLIGVLVRFLSLPKIPKTAD